MKRQQRYSDRVIDFMEDARTQLQTLFNVSHETLHRLTIFHDLLQKWQQRLNLISPNTLDVIWSRHILDCAQLLNYLPQKKCKILDIGSGAGLPGVILAIMTNHEIHLIESDQRKCAFLRTALARANASAVIHENRIESIPLLNADILTARAFAPIPRLLDLTKAQHHKNLRFLLLKGKDVNSELINLSGWKTLQIDQHTSLSSPDGIVVDINFSNAYQDPK